MKQPTRLQLLQAHLLQRLCQRHPEVAAAVVEQGCDQVYHLIQQAQGIALAMFPPRLRHMAYTQIWAFDEEEAI